MKEESWPESELEYLPQCPVCRSDRRITLYSRLTDVVFKCAPGEWTMHRCVDCANAFLDPRPDQSSIGRAYTTYYTHQAASNRPSMEGKTLPRRLLRSFANGFRNSRYGTTDVPASRIGGILFRAAIPLARIVDREFRYLPEMKGQGKVLDVGFGTTRFLDDAKSAGWTTFGVDPDPLTVLNAKSSGHAVCVGGIELFDDMADEFDVITLSHVVEHDHDPVYMLKRAFRLLKPGGQLWLDTPNLDSSGRRLFGRSWRGLEVPRHLVLFAWGPMTKLLSSLGFTSIVRRVPHRVALSMFSASNELVDGPRHGRLKVILLACLAVGRSIACSSSSEFITLTAIKPAGKPS